MRSLLIGLCVLTLSGCGFLRTESKQETHALTKITGTYDGKPIQVTSETVQTSQGTSDTSIDTRDFWSIFSYVLQSFGGGTGIMAIIMAFMKHREVEYHKEDATDLLERLQKEIDKKSA